MFRRKELDSLDRALAIEVLRQVQEHGLDGVRVAVIADRIEVGVGTLYSRWGGRQALMEHTWRMCIASIDYEVKRVLGTFVHENSNGLERICEGIILALPEQHGAFFELHWARRRWQRADLEPDSLVIPTLELYVDLCVKFGHFRPGPSRVMAAVIWWTIMGAVTGPGRHDHHRMGWCIAALKRALLTPERLAYEGAAMIDAVEITEVIS